MNKYDNFIAAWGLAIICLLLLGGCAWGPPTQDGKVYGVCYMPEASFIIDGDLEDEGWGRAMRETGFVFPWREMPTPATEFWACCDRQRLYFAFRVEDDNVVVEEQGIGDEDMVVGEDRVELFFACGARLKKYYCLEIDPQGRVLDYAASYYREFDSHWDWPGLEIAGRTTQGGYIVEGSIPLVSFVDLELGSLLEGECMQVGIFRAEFSRMGNGSVRQEWISWVRPKAENPDFHIPSAFGKFEIRRGED